MCRTILVTCCIKLNPVKNSNLLYVNSSLTNRLLADVMHDYISKLKISPESVDGGIEVKYTKLLHTMRMRARKLLQFARYNFHHSWFRNMQLTFYFI